jgi:hypothetical protein
VNLPDPEAPPPVPGPAARRPGANAARFLAIAAGVGAVLAGAAYLTRRVIESRVVPESAVGLTIASMPLPVAKTPTDRDVRARFRAFESRQYLEGYLKRGVHDKVPDAATEKFIRAYLDRSEIDPDESRKNYLDAEAQRLAHDPGCTDPLVLSLVAEYTLNWYDRMDISKRALALFPGTGYRAYPAFNADVDLMKDTKDGYDQEGELNTSALARLAKCFADGSFQPGDQQEIASLLVDSWGYDFFSNNTDAICNIVNQAGDSYRWLALVLDGERQMINAWNVRGGGYSYTVSDDQRANFKRLLGEGAKRLTEAWELRPDYPMAPSLMVYDTMGSTGLKEMRVWFDRALAAQFDYRAAWANMRFGLQPKWYGSALAELELGKLAVDSGRFDTDVPRKYFDCVMDAEALRVRPSTQRIFRRADIWPVLQKMYEGYIAEPTEAPSRRGWRSSYAAVAYLAGHYDVARKQLEALDWKLTPKTLTTWGADLSPMPLEVAARTGPLGPAIAAAEAARESGDRASAFRLFSDLDGKHTADERTGKFIKLRLSRLTDEQHLMDGKWVSFMPAGGEDGNWTYSFGEARSAADGSLDVEYGPKGHMIISKMTIGGSFEVRGRFDVVRSSNTDFQAGIVIGLPDINTQEWYSFRLKRHHREGDVVVFGHAWTTEEISQHVALNDNSNSFDLVFDDGTVTATVNGEKVFNVADLPFSIRLLPDTFFVGLGAFSDSADTVVRYEGVELRKLGPDEAGLVASSDSDEPANAPAAGQGNAPGAAPTAAEQIAKDQDEMNRAVEQAKLIINKPANSVPIKDGMNITWWDDTWFHPGAAVPDYAKVDITKSQELQYLKYEYVATKLHPETAYPGGGLEFNAMTKIFYTDRSVPKRRLTRSEMAAVNRLYRVIGRCKADLVRLGAK